MASPAKSPSPASTASLSAPASSSKPAKKTTKGEPAKEGQGKEEDVGVLVLKELTELVPSKTDCRVCFKPFEAGQTALLPCCHTVCRKCIVVLKDNAQKNKTAVQCPTCSWPVGDLGQVPENPFIESTVAVHVECAKCKEDGIDKDNAATITCTVCTKPLCPSHADLHRRSTKTATHPLTPLATPTRTMCSVHQQPLDWYCVACNTVICVGCTAKAHARPDHLPEELAEQVPKLRVAVTAAQMAASARHAEVTARITAVRTAVRSVGLDKEDLKAQATATFAAFEGLLRARLQELFKQLDGFSAEEIASLQEDAAADRNRWLALHGGLDLAREVLDAHTTALEAGAVAARTHKQLAIMTEAAVVPAPVRTPIVFEIDDAVERCLRSAGRFVYSRSFAPASTASGTGLTTAITTSAAKFTVTAMTRTNERVRVGGDRVVVRTVLGGTDVDGRPAVVDRGDGTYEVQYTVPATGQLLVHVTLNERAIQGSPFSVTTRNSVFSFTNAPSCYDNQGILYYLATASGTQPWRNPHNAGIVIASASSVGSGALGDLVANGPQNFYTQNLANSWVMVDLKSARVRPRGYVFSDYTSPSGTALRHWRLEGSVDGTAWVPLRVHSNDTTFQNPKFSAYWPVEMADKDAAFSKFRIIQTGLNQYDYRLCCSGVEVYGELLG